MAANNMHNLTTLIKRLEAATSRLEDIASSSVSLDHHDSAQPSQNGVSGSAVAAAVHTAPRDSAATQTQAPAKTELPQMIEDFDTLINGDLKAFEELSKAMAGLLAEQSKAVVEAFRAERQVLLITTKAKKPDISEPVYLDVFKDLQKEMTAVDNIRQNNRASEFKDHLAMVADGVGALAWVTFDSKPADAVAELFGGAQMYGNKVLKQYKDSDQAHVEWVRAFYKVMKSLISYIKQHHAKGVQWNPDGVDAGAALHEVTTAGGGGGSQMDGFSANAPPPPPMPAGGIPPPPGPAPPPHMGDSAKAASQSTDMGAVFADLNKGESVTAGLKKVDPSMQTHKNPSLRARAPVPNRSDSTGSLDRSKAPPGKKPKPESMRTKKPPRKELDGNKWYIENFDSPPQPLEIHAELSHSILITKCRNTTLRIHGKANAVAIDNGVKCNLILDSLVSSLEAIRCQTFAVQILGSLPTVVLDQVDGGIVYLSTDSLAAEVMTSKCSAVNVYLPPPAGQEDEDYAEHSVPEQLRSFVRDGRLITEIVEHAG